jgi:hypothetical protein
MTIRSSSRIVTFTNPFSIPGVEGVHPAGPYEITTDEELIGDLTFLAWRRVATTIRLSSAGVTQVHAIDPDVLEAALLCGEVLG